MLNELIIGRRQCPVCGRYIFGNLKYWWCPYCGSDNTEENIIISNPTDRITARDENGVAVYIGIHSPNSYTYAPYMGINAIHQIVIHMLHIWELMLLQKFLKDFVKRRKRMKTYTAKTNRIIQDEDASTAKALGIEPIPKGATVEVIGTYNNTRGHYIKIKYHGYVYYTKEAYLDK